jgi:hypothetical protein
MPVSSVAVDSNAAHTILDTIVVDRQLRVLSVLTGTARLCVSSMAIKVRPHSVTRTYEYTRYYRITHSTWTASPSRQHHLWVAVASLRTTPSDLSVTQKFADHFMNLCKRTALLRTAHLPVGKIVEDLEKVIYCLYAAVSDSSSSGSMATTPSTENGSTFEPTEVTTAHFQPNSTCNYFADTANKYKSKSTDD